VFFQYPGHIPAISRSYFFNIPAVSLIKNLYWKVSFKQETAGILKKYDRDMAGIWPGY
jgi:hypothetical protein